MGFELDSERGKQPCSLTDIAYFTNSNGKVRYSSGCMPLNDVLSKQTLVHCTLRLSQELYYTAWLRVIINEG